MKELKSLCKTRWCSQAEACDAIVATLGSVISLWNTLQMMTTVKDELLHNLLWVY